MSSMFKVEDIFGDVPSTDAAVNFDRHEVTEGKANALSLLSELPGGRKYKNLRLSDCQLNGLQ